LEANKMSMHETDSLYLCPLPPPILAQLEANKMSMHEREFSIWTCLDFCMEMLVLKSQTKGLDLAYNVDPSVPQ